MTSGIPIFNNISHDFSLALKICQGLRPNIIEGTLPEYAKLMKNVGILISIKDRLLKNY